MFNNLYIYIKLLSSNMKQIVCTLQVLWIMTNNHPHISFIYII